VAYSYQVQASDPDGDALSYALATAPAGMTISATGLITWTPDAQGAFSVELSVTDGEGGNATQSYTVTVSPATVTVPDVVGLTQSEAEAAITAASLTVGTVTQAASDIVPAGNVVSQDPAAGTSVAQASAVDLVISSGPQGGGELPPDPSTVAPPVEPGVATTVADSTAFLYTGDNPIQTGVAPGSIEMLHAAVLRGRVLDRSDGPLPGVTLRILGHPEYGETLSRADGMFDMAVNGGGPLTVKYQKDGYLPAQRQVNVPWQDYIVLDDVVLVPRDGRVTTIDLADATTMHAAQGSAVTDADGTRQPALLIPAGTQASEVMPDGTTEPLTTLSLRFTEYTVGSSGPKAMPAPLPPTSGYTYALELAADEAPTKLNGQDVVFDRPVSFYVDNFLGFPVGGAVPVGYYDSTRGTWIPSNNGRIIQILAITNGLANLDVNGSGQPADATALALLGITDEERAQLASLYSAGKSLWRVQLIHLSTWDCNWPYGPPEDSEPPKNDPPNDKRPPVDKQRQSCGSIIGCEGQTLGEALDIVGTPFRLHYQSERSVGHTADRTLDIPLSGASVPASLDRITLDISVAGRQFHQEFPAFPNQRTTFTWDGNDAYGRPVQGMQAATITIGYVYGAVYQEPAQLQQSFAAFSGVPMTANRARGEVTLSQVFTVRIGPWDARPLGLGGWSLSTVHVYDPLGQTLYFGDGTRRSAAGINSDVITTVAGNGTAGFSGDGGPATEAALSYPYGVAVGPDGSLYIADANNYRIRRVGPDGIITTVAGNGTYGSSGDGGPATEAALSYPYGGVAVDPDGSLYIGDTINGRIRRVAPDGIITTVAGSGTYGFSGDGGLATEAALAHPRGVAVGPDGSLYIADSGNYRIRRVGPDGIIATVAGNGTIGFSGDGGPATAAALSSPYGVAVGPDGGLYVVGQGSQRIRRVGPVLPSLSLNDIAVPSSDGSQLYVFGGTGRHLRTVNALTGAPLYQFGYDSAERLTSVTDADGNVTTIERDAGGNPAAIVAPFGQRTALALNANGYLASVTNPAGERYAMTYTADGLLTSFTDPRGNSSAMSYDALGRLTRDDDPAGGFQTLAFAEDPAGNTVTRTTALGRATQYRTERLPIGTIWRATTGPDGTLTEMLTGTDGSEKTTRADGSVLNLLQGPDPRFSMQAPIASSLTTTTGGLTSTVTTERTVALSDPNNLLSLTALNDTVTVNGRTFTSAYDAATRTFTDTSAAGRVSNATIDVRGRPVQTQTAGLAATSYGYDARGRLVSISQGSGADTRTTTLTYDPEGYLDTLTDALGRTVSFAYDGAGRVTSQTLPDGRVIDYAYDAKGNRAAITPSQRPPHAFAYTPVDLQSAYIPPDVGAGLNRTDYAYGLDREIELVTRPDSLLIDPEYDAAGRLNALTVPEGQFGYSYDPTTGQLTGITTPDGGTLSFTYAGSLLRSVAWGGAVAGKVGYVYDNDFRVTEISLNGANPVVFGYDADSLLTQAGALSLIRDAQNGLLIGSTLGSLTDAWTYNAFAEAASYSASYAGAPVFTTRFTRDALGRITEKVETVAGATTTYGYRYDLVGRLTEVTVDGVTLSTYAYDANGNRLSRTSAQGTETGTYDDQDRLLTYAGASYTYTANGELASKTTGGQTTTYQYDVLGNLRQVVLPGGATVEYLTDGQNRRIGKKVNGILVQSFLYQDQLKPVAELDGTGNMVSRFVYATRVNVPDYMIKGGVTYRLITDHLGSPRLVVDTASGTVVQRMDYDEFGRVILDTNPGFQPFGFAGGVYDRDTGLARFGARDYDPMTGRWTAKDPIRFAGGMNVYTYAKGDPVNRVDLIGRISTQVDIRQAIAAGIFHAGVGAAVGASSFGVASFGVAALPAALIGGFLGGVAGFSGDIIAQAFGLSTVAGVIHLIP
jgi:RHS repeat-associated protein